VREIGALAIDYPASNARRASFAAVAGNVGDSATRLRTTHHRDAHHRAQNVHGLECISVLHNNCISFIYYYISNLVYIGEYRLASFGVENDDAKVAAAKNLTAVVAHRALQLQQV